MAINLSLTTGGLKIVTANTSFILNEWSTKRNDLNKDEITIISDVKDNYAELDINFAANEVYYNDETVADAESLETILEAVGSGGSVVKNNSTNIPLGADEVYTGESIDVSNVAIMYVSLTSDASGTLTVEQSIDNVNWDFVDIYYFVGGNAKTYSFQGAVQFARIKYTNNGTPQTYFRLQTIIKNRYGKPSSHRIQDTINDDDDGELTVNVLKLRTAQDDYVSAASTTQGNFKTSIEELETGVSTNENSQLNVSPFIVDEYANYAHILGDNIFRGAPITISSEHHEIHCGDSYEATDNITLGNGATRDYLIIVPDEGTVDGSNPGDDQSVKLYHFLELIESEAEVEVALYEGADRVAGTAITSYNRNRNSTNTDTLNISHTPTGGTTDGTIIWGAWRIGAGRTGAGSRGRNAEIVLKNNTKYILKITNQTTSNNNVNVEFDYYVHPGV